MAAGNEPQEVIPPEEMTSRDFYRDKLAHFSYHEVKIKDEVRMMAYYHAIMGNEHLFKDKTVVEIPCGMGVLSMLAARAGARHVVAIDDSRVIDQARKVIQANNLQNQIILLEGKVDQIELPAGVKEVDIIISDWMDQCLFKGSILNTVIHARNKWLNKGGIMIPDFCTLYLAAVDARSLRESEIDFWDNVQGFDMKVIGKEALKEPLATDVESAEVVTDAYLIKTIDMCKVTTQDTNFESSYQLKANRNVEVHGMMTYFNVQFKKINEGLMFSTSPDAPPTHYRQTVFFLDDYLTVNQGETINGTFKLQMHGRNGRNRELDIDIDVDFNGEVSSKRENAHYVIKP